MENINSTQFINLFKDSIKKPTFIIIGAEWCPTCSMLKSSFENNLIVPPTDINIYDCILTQDDVDEKSKFNVFYNLKTGNSIMNLPILIFIKDNNWEISGFIPINLLQKKFNSYWK